jgi:hypothetical protein
MRQKGVATVRLLGMLIFAFWMGMLACSHLMLGNRGESLARESSAPANNIRNNSSEYANHAGGASTDHFKSSPLEWHPGSNVMQEMNTESSQNENKQVVNRAFSNIHEKERYTAQNSQEEEQSLENKRSGHWSAVDVNDFGEEGTDSAQEDSGAYKNPNPVVLQLSQGRSGSTVTATLTLEAHPYCGFFLDELV